MDPPDLIIMGCGLHSMLDEHLVATPSTQKRLQEYGKQLRQIMAVSSSNIDLFFFTFSKHNDTILNKRESSLTFSSPSCKGGFVVWLPRVLHPRLVASAPNWAQPSRGVEAEQTEEFPDKAVQFIRHQRAEKHRSVPLVEAIGRDRTNHRRRTPLQRRDAQSFEPGSRLKFNF